MALEASEVAVRVRLLGGSAFETEAAGIAGSVEKINTASKGSLGGIASMGNRAHTMLTKTGGKLTNVGNKLMGVGRAATAVGIPIAAIGYYSAKASASFGQAMTLLVTQAGMPMKTLKGLSNTVEGMATKFGATPLALAQALYPIESIGLRGRKALKALKAAAIGSAVGLDSLENTADAVTTIMASHIKGAGGPVEAMSIMDRAIGLGKMHLADLTDSFKSGIVPMSKQFGLSFKQIVSSAAALTRLGIPANQVMARMRLTLTSMIAPTTMGQKALASMGLTQFQLADDLRKKNGLFTALQDLKTHADLLPRDLGNQAIAEMFGKSRGMGQIASLLSSLPQANRIYGKAMSTTPKTLMEHFGETQKTAAFKYKQVAATFDKVMIKLGNTINKYILPLIVKLIPHLSAAVKWFGQLPGPVKKMFVFLGGILVVAGPILLFFGGLAKVGGGVLSLLGTLGGGFGKLAAKIGAGGLLGEAGELGGGFMSLLGPIGLAAGALMTAYALIKSGVIKNLLDSIFPQAGRKDQHLISTYKHYKGAQGYQHDKTLGYIQGKMGPHGWIDNPYAHARTHLPHGFHLIHRGGVGMYVPGAATGAVVRSGGSVLVGEQGPELLNLPGGATVSPLPKMSGASLLHDNAKVRGDDMKFETTINVPVYLDSKIIANSVATVNRKNLNRR